MIDSKLQKIIVKQLRTTPDKVKPEAFFINDLGADSIEIIEMVMVVEKDFNVQIPDEEAEKLKTVQALQDYLVAHGKI